MQKFDLTRKRELDVQREWGTTAFEADADPSKKKYFITFPFPYANGRLHLGHVFTMLKADIMARYHRMRGFNVLFPFGFHGTGIPISVAAQRLAEVSGIQQNLMKKMGIDEQTISRFVDPKYWLAYFPSKTIDDLQSLGCSIDYRRSFVTTDCNKHFDSFIRWQFNKLNQKQYLKFGKKMVIYSEKDGQPCSDADRIVGEGVGIRELRVAFLNLAGCYCYVTFDEGAPDDTIVRSSSLPICSYRYAGNTLYASKEFCRNNGHQVGLVLVADEEPLDLPFFESINLKHGSGFYTSKKDLIWLPYFEPESMVVSRSGDICVVTNTDQWYIMYDIPKWKNAVYEHVSTKTKIEDPTVRQIILDSILKSHPWPFSRTFGLGTKIPFDEKYIIDPLSDSTIYMAYYTVSHLVTQIDASQLSDDLWDGIFYGKKTDIENVYPELMKKMQTEFNYWYPVDIRISGKDLLTNHLTMTFFNHWAIFGPEMMPKKIYANGYIQISGQKMSKSSGNFVTINQAVQTHGADACRLIASAAGDDTNDGNFNEAEVEPALLNLCSEVEKHERAIKCPMRNGPYEFSDLVHLVWLNHIIRKVEDAYNSMKLINVSQYALHEMQSIRNKYENPHHNVYNLYMQSMITLMEPIIPHWSSYMSTSFGIPIGWPEVQIDPAYNTPRIEWLVQYCQIIRNKLTGRLKKFNKKGTGPKDKETGPKDKGSGPKAKETGPKAKPEPIICTIIINNDVGPLIQQILSVDTTNKDQKRSLINKFPNVVDLMAHIDSMMKTFGREDVGTWLLEDHSSHLQSYLCVCFHNVRISIIYDGGTTGDPLNPNFKFG